MVFEIIGSRIVSPFIGSSTYVWTSLIGVILAALSLGYWLGGKVADKHPSQKIMGSIVLGAGSLIGLTILIKDVFLSIVAGGTGGLEIKAVIAAVVLFGPASVFLGMVTPFAVRLKMTAIEETGKTVGRLYALSTIGSIVGTFAAGFYLIPFIGSVRTLYIIAATLIALALVIGFGSYTTKTIASILLLMLGIGASESVNYLMRVNSELHDTDTEYSRVQVFRSLDPETGKPIRAIATDPYFVQSAAFLDSDDLVLRYSHFYHLIRHFRPGFDRTLMIGGAGYSFPREYLKTYPAAHMDVIEIDRRMTKIARDLFGLRDDPRMAIYHEDARMFINRAAAEKYDAVLMDAFGSLFSVPYHLTTVEAVLEMNRILKEDGVVIFNLGSSITGTSSGFLQAQMRTYLEVFPHVYLFKVRQEYGDDRLQNLIIVASKARQPISTNNSDPAISALLAKMYTDSLVLEREILTDDLAPVEYYNSIAQNLYLANPR